MSDMTNPDSNYEIAGNRYYQQVLSGGQFEAMVEIFANIPTKYLEEGEIGEIVLHLLQTKDLSRTLAILLIPEGSEFSDDKTYLTANRQVLLKAGAIELLAVGKKVVTDFLAINVPSLKQLSAIFPAAGTLIEATLEYVQGSSTTGTNSTTG